MRSYADVARENIERPLGKIDSYFIVYLFHQGISLLGFIGALLVASIASTECPAPPQPVVPTYRGGDSQKFELSLLSFDGSDMSHHLRHVNAEREEAM